MRFYDRDAVKDHAEMLALMRRFDEWLEAQFVSSGFDDLYSYALLNQDWQGA